MGILISLASGSVTPLVVFYRNRVKFNTHVGLFSELVMIFDFDFKDIILMWYMMLLIQVYIILCHSYLFIAALSFMCKVFTRIGNIKSKHLFCHTNYSKSLVLSFMSWMWPSTVVFSLQLWSYHVIYLLTGTWETTLKKLFSCCLYCLIIYPNLQNVCILSYFHFCITKSVWMYSL